MEEVWGSNPHSSTLTKHILTRVFAPIDSPGGPGWSDLGASLGASSVPRVGRPGHGRTDAQTAAAAGYAGAAHGPGMQKRPLRVAAPASSADTGDRLAAQLDQAVAQLHQAAVDLAALRAQIQSATDAGEPTSMLLSPEEVAILLGIGR